MRRVLPSGTVTLLFSDVEGSTRLLADLGTVAYADAMVEHRRLLREIFAAHGGVEVDTQGDSFLFAFPTATGAASAASKAHGALADGPMRVRIGIHTGTPELTDEGYFGPDVHRGARIAQAAHGGQTVVSAATAALLGNIELRDLGAHRLRDFPAEHLYQLGDGEFAPLRTRYQVNLPTPPTLLVGRTAELAAIAALLRSDDVRLLTLTGAGGAGKTRLALAAADEVADRYPDGVWWVPLAALRDPRLVIESVAAVLGASGDVSARIGQAHMLVVLDNFEQVRAASVEIARLLERCPNVELLVTSRAPLRVAAEHEFAVPPLARGEASQLFIARARAHGVDVADDPATLERVDTLCSRLDHLPLAIELAAARAKVMSIAELLRRIESRLPLLTGGPGDQPERQRTLRATIEWSYDLLDEPERALFAALAAFRGGWDLDAADAVAGADVDRLAALVEHSLVRLRGERYAMLETIGEFAVERLAASPLVDDIHRRHAEHFLALAEEAEQHLYSFSREWLDRLALEHDNLRAAFDRLEARGETQDALRLAGALQRFWIVRGHLAEGRRRVDQLLARDRQPTAARGKALNGAALLALNTGDPQTAKRLAAEALALHRRLRHAWGVARSAFVLGYAHADEGDFDRARVLFEESGAGFAALGDAHNVMFVTSNMSWLYRELGDVARARALEEENLVRARRLGNESIVALSLSGLALAALDDGDPATARAMLVEALEIDRRLGDVRRSVDDMCRLARALAVAGEHVAAARLLAGAERLHAEIGASVSPDIAQLNRETYEMLRAAMGVLPLEQAVADARRLTFDEAFDLALRRDGQAAVGPSDVALEGGSIGSG